MKFSIKGVKFVQCSNRIHGTTDDGKEYDYYRVTMWMDDQQVNFSVRNNAENQKLIDTVSPLNFGAVCDITVNLSKARQGAAWYMNLVEVK